MKQVLGLLLPLFALCACTPTFEQPSANEQKAIVQSSQQMSQVLERLPVQKAEDFTLESLLTRLGQASSHSISFVGERTVSFRKEPIITKGTIVYHAPDTLVQTLVYPKHQVLTFTPTQVLIDTGEQQRTVPLNQSPLLALPMQLYRLLQQGSLPALKKQFAVSLLGDQRHWSLTLQPLEQALSQQVQKIRLLGAEDKIQGMEILLRGGDKMVLQFGRVSPAI